LEIIGKETPVVDGLEIGESGHSVYAPPKSTVEELTPETIPSIPSPTLAPSRLGKYQFGRKNLRRTPVGQTDAAVTKKQKLQCELMEIKIYKHRLECLRIERDLSLPRSTFTEKVFEPVSLNE
jgi:hypothetical protein